MCMVSLALVTDAARFSRTVLLVFALQDVFFLRKGVLVNGFKHISGTKLWQQSQSIFEIECNSRRYRAVDVNASNTVTWTDSIVYDVWGPAGIAVYANSPAERVDIVQLNRVTFNQAQLVDTHRDVVWLYIGPGVNTVRLFSAGFINGGNAIRMTLQPLPNTAVVAPQAAFPLFLFADDLEIDFPNNDAIVLDNGRVFNCVNCYIQGSVTGHGVHVGPQWAKEIQLSNCRISGHNQNGVWVQGGTHLILHGNIIADNSRQGPRVASGVNISSGVSNFVITGNVVGAVQSERSGKQAYGIAVLPGASDHYVISSNVCTGNLEGGVLSGGEGASISVANNVD
eukprot:m.179360 g.179360  ORF g.179360 m.179360 type:complete len:340 (-) comp18390_c0_seq4:110-1129(-)